MPSSFRVTELRRFATECVEGSTKENRCLSRPLRRSSADLELHIVSYGCWLSAREEALNRVTGELWLRRANSLEECEENEDRWCRVPRWWRGYSARWNGDPWCFSDDPLSARPRSRPCPRHMDPPLASSLGCSPSEREVTRRGTDLKLTDSDVTAPVEEEA